MNEVMTSPLTLNGSSQTTHNELHVTLSYPNVFHIIQQVILSSTKVIKPRNVT